MIVVQMRSTIITNIAPYDFRTFVFERDPAMQGTCRVLFF